MEVLIRVGRVNRDFALSGNVLLEQAGKLDARITESEAAGEPWKLSDLVTFLSAPLNEPIRVSAGAVIAGRIRTLPRTPRTAMVPTQASGERPAPLPAPTLVVQGPGAECPGLGDERCGNPAGTTGLCNSCASTKDGVEAPECARPGCNRSVAYEGLTCFACRNTDPDDDAHTCPGLNGMPCGRPVQPGMDLCGRHIITAAQQRGRVYSQFERERVEAVAAAKAAEAAEGGALL